MTGRIARLVSFLAAAVAIAAAGGDTRAMAAEPWSLGAYLAGTCAPCHGSPDQGIPAIAGLAEDKILARLAQYRNGEKKHDIMSAVARSLSDAEAVAVARHLSRLPGESP